MPEMLLIPSLMAASFALGLIAARTIWSGVPYSGGARQPVRREDRS